MRRAITALRLDTARPAAKALQRQRPSFAGALHAAGKTPMPRRQSLGEASAPWGSRSGRIQHQAGPSTAASTAAAASRQIADQRMGHGRQEHCQRTGRRRQQHPQVGQRAASCASHGRGTVSNTSVDRAMRWQGADLIPINMGAFQPCADGACWALPSLTAAGP